MIKITSDIVLNDEEIEWRFIRASGPGGQNVNKVASAAQLRFNVRKTQAFSDAVKKRLMTLVGNRMNSEGELVLTGRRFRTQKQNRDDALNRLVHFIILALHEPKIRKKSRISKEAQEKRLATKKRQSKKKKMRSFRGEET